MKNIFWIFGVLQVLSLGFICFFVLVGAGVGWDSAVVLSSVFSISTLIVEYLIYSK